MKVNKRSNVTASRWHADGHDNYDYGITAEILGFIL
jgi:hypothetical protein